MTDKELIEQEIEILYAEVSQRSYNGEVEGEMCAYDKLISFIDSLSEEPDCEKKDYCERYEKLTQSDTFKSSYCDKSLGKEESTDEANCTPQSDDLEEAAKHYLYGAILYDDIYVGNPTEEDCIRCFKAGAEWQKRKDKETIELAKDYAMLAGMMKEREEMMKNAVDATIVNDWQYGKDPDHAVIPAIHQRIDGFNVGDKVKIIIVKEE